MILNFREFANLASVQHLNRASPGLITFVTISGGPILYCNIEFLTDFYVVMWSRGRSTRAFVRSVVDARQALHVFGGLGSIYYEYQGSPASSVELYNDPTTVEKDRKAPDEVSLIPWESRR